MIESPSSSKERTELHLGLYAGLAAMRAQALEDAEEARKELERETDPEFSRALRGAIHGAEGIVEWIDEAIGGPRCPPKITKVVDALRVGAEVRSRGTAVALVLAVMDAMDAGDVVYAALSDVHKDWARDATVPFYSCGATMFPTESLKDTVALDHAIGAVLQDAMGDRYADGRVTGAVVAVAALRGRGRSTIWKAWKKLVEASV